ncbi:uncharacterized protein LOC123562056 [Mercenaria mercenaria]|uniref:uncharacterized protein LOC123562056 n=1 Tax=Mercenaria mercenaria TaxID=6596 RepID=UPI00234E9E6D|nr:uncharacterized protein LOC123562056 [Mercenaria mercenaria]
MKRRERLEKRAGELGLTDKRKRRDEPPLVIPHQDNEVENQRQDEAPPLVIPQQDPPLVIPQRDNEVQQLVQNDVGGDCVQKGTDDCSPGPGKVIWCLGSSLIKKAFITARSTRAGLNLGLDGVEIWWQGYGGLCLTQLLSKLRTLCRVRDEPDFLLVHCGGNNLGKTKLKELRSEIVKIVDFKNTHLSSTVLIWSNILPRINWRYSDNRMAMDRSLKRLNSYGAKRVVDSGGVSLQHPRINVQSPTLFQGDRVHLSEEGNMLFLHSLASQLDAIVNV